MVEEGLGGRTTVWDDPFTEGRNGQAYLLPCLRSHAPIDVLVVMLGTNDLKAIFRRGPPRSRRRAPRSSTSRSPRGPGRRRPRRPARSSRRRPRAATDRSEVWGFGAARARASGSRARTGPPRSCGAWRSSTRQRSWGRTRPTASTSAPSPRDPGAGCAGLVRLLGPHRGPWGPTPVERECPLRIVVEAVDRPIGRSCGLGGPSGADNLRSPYRRAGQRGGLGPLLRVVNPPATRALAAQDARLLGIVEGRPRFEIDTRTSRFFLL